MKNENKILSKIEEMIKISYEIREIDENIGEVFLLNIHNAMKILQAVSGKEETFDMSEKLILLSNLLGVDLTELIKHIVDEETSKQNIETDNADKDVMDFIINNTDIDDYEAFLKENEIKEDIDYLKGVL